MDFSPVERENGSFQQSVTADQIISMCRRIFGDGAGVVSADELGNGMYNNTYRVDVADVGPVILRVAPEPSRQFGSERELMRSEYASVPFFAPIAPLVPRTLGADFTHEVIGRDFLFQTLLPGRPVPQALGGYDRQLWPSLYRDLGTIAAKIHAVRGPAFGSIRNPQFARWSDAFVALLDGLAADVDSVGLDSADIRQVASIAGKQQAVLDEITEPRLLHGDLWTVNVMLVEDAPQPTITGVFDNDRTLWGDPAADWTIRMAAKKPGTERDAFWETYGAPSTTPGAAIRSLFYEARHVAAIRLERHRLGKTEDVPETYGQMRDIIEKFHA
ncbi:aminoglycoside phosphotransferase (APT) family kinase protein [Allocatelliglobosispora scoriae]|uniref:Aminoglycoside phosphotransferase (APT) family kinase protein n=1 Tax=Allocatelliglobosispora scoriae TaxID=643052 RepID=A0A841BHS3_9ACTN|nr:aminoglycoside phosphotransferase family protein [Allocatelliglobosispora scoriae]MBB5866726.1 aminoglycoside phosphotransferase (APT) family kinase protein [Allocatelliglobosispora scoriae]